MVFLNSMNCSHEHLKKKALWKLLILFSYNYNSFASLCRASLKIFKSKFYYWNLFLYTFRLLCIVYLATPLEMFFFLKQYTPNYPCRALIYIHSLWLLFFVSYHNLKRKKTSIKKLRKGFCEFSSWDNRIWLKQHYKLKFIFLNWITRTEVKTVIY